jgi:hypothetical protein
MADATVARPAPEGLEQERAVGSFAGGVRLCLLRFLRFLRI